MMVALVLGFRSIVGNVLLSVQKLFELLLLAR